MLSPSALWRRMGLAHHNWPGRFTVLLATILLLLITLPIFASHAFAQNLATATIALVLLAAIYVIRALRTFSSSPRCWLYLQSDAASPSNSPKTRRSK